MGCGCKGRGARARSRKIVKDNKKEDVPKKNDILEKDIPKKESTFLSINELAKKNKSA